ncbi:MAG TPA: type II secretion system protein [Candidatus Udaeobacter sp.]|jgi:prepilin-type N-terminal cleavage/methylation domain-containing protein/prepilin-type processing-associated H-X9-DG protein|nr:type II secretion system protein [Candidatus Udaeobacter sp.]
MKNKCSNAFTLIELLVVLGCLAIMMSMIYPVFFGMTQRAFSAKDMNNMRQIGMALQTYLNDKEGVIPRIKDPPGMGTDASPVIYPVYIATRKVFQSPFDKRTASETDGAPVSYGINQNTYDLINANMLSVRSPSSTILMAPNYNGDPAVNASWTGTATAVPNLAVAGGGGMTLGTHLKGTQINALFFDLHVETMTFGPNASPAAGSFKDFTTVPLGQKHWDPTK